MKKLNLFFNINSVIAYVLNGKQARSHTELLRQYGSKQLFCHTSLQKNYFTDINVEVLVCICLRKPA